MTGFFVGETIQVVKELENFRELQSYCAHDLRSQVGALSGLLSLLQDHQGPIDLTESPSFQAALSSAQEALKFIDEKVAVLKPRYDVIWTLGFEPFQNQMSSWSLPQACLILNFSDLTMLVEHLNRYRPKAVYFKAVEQMGPNPKSLVYKLGPQLVKIFVFSENANPLPEVRPEAVTLLRGDGQVAQVLESLLKLLAPQP